jgi:hypothetical protein
MELVAWLLSYLFSYSFSFFTILFLYKPIICIFYELEVFGRRRFEAHTLSN